MIDGNHLVYHGNGSVLYELGGRFANHSPLGHSGGQAGRRRTHGDRSRRAGDSSGSTRCIIWGRTTGLCDPGGRDGQGNARCSHRTKSQGDRPRRSDSRSNRLYRANRARIALCIGARRVRELFPRPIKYPFLGTSKSSGEILRDDRRCLSAHRAVVEICNLPKREANRRCHTSFAIRPHVLGHIPGQARCLGHVV